MSRAIATIKLGPVDLYRQLCQNHAIAFALFCRNGLLLGHCMVFSAPSFFFKYDFNKQAPRKICDGSQWNLIALTLALLWIRAACVCFCAQATCIHTKASLRQILNLTSNDGSLMLLRETLACEALACEMRLVHLDGELRADNSRCTCIYCLPMKQTLLKRVFVKWKLLVAIAVGFGVFIRRAEIR